VKVENYPVAVSSKKSLTFFATVYSREGG